MMFVGNGNTKEKFAEIGLAFLMVSTGKNYRHRNTNVQKWANFLIPCPQNGLKIAPYQLTQSAPNLTYSHLSLKNVPGGENPRTPASKGISWFSGKSLKLLPPDARF